MTRTSGSPQTASQRDLRLDFFRGVALICIFIDHIPEDYLNYFTLSAIAFSDAAEVFIFISGFTASLVYGRVLATRGFVLAASSSPYCIQINVQCVVQKGSLMIIDSWFRISS